MPKALKTATPHSGPPVSSKMIWERWKGGGGVDGNWVWLPAPRTQGPEAWEEPPSTAGKTPTGPRKASAPRRGFPWNEYLRHLLEVGCLQRLSRRHCLATPRTWTNQDTKPLPQPWFSPLPMQCLSYLGFPTQGASLYPSTHHSHVHTFLLSFLPSLVHSFT